MTGETLTAQMARTTNHVSHQYMTEGLKAVAAHLEPGDAAQLAQQLAPQLANTEDPYSLAALAEGLMALAARLEPAQAQPLATDAAGRLTEQLAKMEERLGDPTSKQGTMVDAP